MNKLTLLIITILTSATLFSQQTGYYDGTEGKSGEELKAALNDIIQDHMPWSYNFAKTIF